jgi:cytidylate kinase
MQYGYRDLAKEWGKTFEEVQKEVEKNEKIDYLVDRKLFELSKSSKDWVIGSRLACWIVESAHLRVWLHASPGVRAKRISKRDGSEEVQTVEYTEWRDASNTRRYFERYGIDVLKHDDVMEMQINTSLLDAEETAKLIALVAREAKEERRIPETQKILEAIRNKLGD